MVHVTWGDATGRGDVTDVYVARAVLSGFPTSYAHRPVSIGDLWHDELALLCPVLDEPDPVIPPDPFWLRFLYWLRRMLA